MAGAVNNSIKTSTLKSRILHNAQTSIYQVTIAQPPGGGLGRFLASSGRGFNWNNNSQLDVELRCFSAVLPGSALATHEIQHDYIGVNDRSAYRRLYDESIDLSFYVDYDYNVIELFDGWMDYISGLGSNAPRETYRNPSANFRVRYPSEYKTSLFVTKFEKDLQRKAEGHISSVPAIEYEFINAFPILTNSIPVTYENSQVLKMTVRFSYMRYIRARKQVTVSDELGLVNYNVSPRLLPS